MITVTPRLEQTGIKCLLRHQDRIHRMTSEASEWQEENKSAGEGSVCRKLKYLFPLCCISRLPALRRNRPHLPAPWRPPSPQLHFIPCSCALSYTPCHRRHLPCSLSVGSPISELLGSADATAALVAGKHRQLRSASVGFDVAGLAQQRR